MQSHGKNELRTDELYVPYREIYLLVVDTKFAVDTQLACSASVKGSATDCTVSVKSRVKCKEYCSIVGVENRRQADELIK